MTDSHELDALFEAELPPPGGKRVAVIIGRFQPPSRGHYEVISAVKRFIREHKNLKLETAPVIAIIGGSKADSNSARNPLSVEERELFMSASGQANGCTFVTATNAFAALAKLRELGLEPLAIAAGEDRAKGYLDILDKYFKNQDESPIKHYVIELPRAATAVDADAKKTGLDAALSRLKTGADLDVDEISGSLARRAVELGYEPEFARIVGLEKKPELARKMFNRVKKALG